MKKISFSKAENAEEGEGRMMMGSRSPIPPDTIALTPSVANASPRASLLSLRSSLLPLSHFSLSYLFSSQKNSNNA